MKDLFGAVSTADTGERADQDFYETPAWMTRSLLAHQPGIEGATVFECAAGRNAITRVLEREGGCTVLTNDINRQQPTDFHFDARDGKLWTTVAATGVRGRRVLWVVSNFPFDVAFEILQHAIDAVPNVAILLRKTFTEPTIERGPWLAAHPPTRIIGLPRQVPRLVIR